MNRYKQKIINSVTEKKEKSISRYVNEKDRKVSWSDIVKER